ncbi:MAG: IS1634 family transposase, partial [Campylobacterota bacterium]
MACIIMQRALHPCSKRAFSSWSKKTFLPILYDFDYAKITSQHFWDMMDYVEDDDLKKIEETITKDIFHSMRPDLDLLLYDYTNFFTFIDSSNNRCAIAQRGKNKQKRNDLRQFSLALLITRDFKIPIFSDIYAGNTADAKEFSATIPKIQERLKLLSKSIEDITLVFDKGSNSKDNFTKIKNINYVASLSVFHDEELKKIPFSDFKEISITQDGEKVAFPVYRTNKEIWGKKRTIVMYKSGPLYEGHVKGFNRDLSRTKEELETLKESVKNGYYKKNNQKRNWTPEILRERVESIINKQFVREVITFEILKKKDKTYDLSYEAESSQMLFLEERVFGKIILIT